MLGVTLLAAAILGDAVNYFVGRFFGARLLSRPRRLVRPDHVTSTEAFYARHGGKTIILARFVPFARTFAPFVAGVIRMDPLRFVLFNVIGAALWVGLFVGAGVWFGNIPWVKENLTLVLVAVVLVSVGPAVFAMARRRLQGAAGAVREDGQGGSTPG
jgi:membrane-associated protein